MEAATAQETECIYGEIDAAYDGPETTMDPVLTCTIYLTLVLEQSVQVKNTGRPHQLIRGGGQFYDQ